MTTEPIYSRDLRAAGLSSVPVESAARAGVMHRIRPGVYADAQAWLQLPGREQHLLRMTAVARTFPTTPIFSHESAAAVWGMPVLGGWPLDVIVAVTGSNGMSRRRGVRGARAVFDDGDVVRRGSLHVTSVARTALDLAQARSLAQGVAALDHAIAAGALPREGIVADMAARRPFHGVRRLERATAAAFGRSESALESLSMARFLQFGWPLPEQQREFVTASGRRYRSDFYWPDWDVIGEADGRMKYACRDDLWAEKRREDDLRELCRRFVRWTWDEAWNGTALAERLHRVGLPRAARFSAHLHE